MEKPTTGILEAAMKEIDCDDSEYESTWNFPSLLSMRQSIRSIIAEKERIKAGMGFPDDGDKEDEMWILDYVHAQEVHQHLKPYQENFPLEKYPLIYIFSFLVSHLLIFYRQLEYEIENDNKKRASKILFLKHRLVALFKFRDCKLTKTEMFLLSESKEPELKNISSLYKTFCEHQLHYLLDHSSLYSD